MAEQQKYDSLKKPKGHPEPQSMPKDEFVFGSLEGRFAVMWYQTHGVLVEFKNCDDFATVKKIAQVGRVQHGRPGLRGIKRFPVFSFVITQSLVEDWVNPTGSAAQEVLGMDELYAQPDFCYIELLPPGVDVTKLPRVHGN